MRAAVNVPEILEGVSVWFDSGAEKEKRGLWRSPSSSIYLYRSSITALGTYISGSFCVSRTAAMGIPKFEAGPQKSAPKVRSRFFVDRRARHRDLSENHQREWRRSRHTIKQEQNIRVEQR